jgi:hypothetical protein
MVRRNLQRVSQGIEALEKPGTRDDSGTRNRDGANWFFLFVESSKSAADEGGLPLGGSEGRVCPTFVAAAKKGIPVPALSTALAFYDQYRNTVLPANLLQAQRDYFGAHTYERVDKPRGEFFHTNWTGRGGATASGTYNV